MRGVDGRVTSWVVVGAGPHGVAVATALVERLGSGAVTVVDPGPEPLARWHARAAAIGMDALRSPWVHHVAREPFDLHRFLVAAGAKPAGFAPPLAAFGAHARARLAACPPTLVRDAVTGLGRTAHGWRVALAGGGELAAERVAVAVGLDPFRRPVLGGVPLPDRQVAATRGRVAVVGGGHTAATAARRLLESGGRVDLFAPGGLRERATDVDPGWLGPKLLRAWDAQAPEQRLAALRGARQGTTTPALRAWLRARIPPGLLHVVAERVTAVEAGVVTTASGAHGPYPVVYEATGYTVDVARVPWLAPHVPRALGGLPVLDRHLQAAPGLHLLGPLAELELGPAGRNLWGAMRATERLLAVS